MIQFRMRKFLLFAVAIFVLSPLHAQVSTPDAPAQANLAKETPLNPALPTVFIVGDSTARNGADLGWGDHFAPLFDTSRLNVANRAHAGRSSRTFINEGLWSAVLSEMKPGDFVLIQMGHNDGGDLGGPKPRGTLKGIGDETQDVPQTTGPLAGKVETVHTYGWYIRKYIADTRAKGASPILLSLTVRNVWKDGPDGKPHIERDMGYDALLRQLASSEHVPFIDMTSLAADHFESIGPQATAACFPIDHTHTSAACADLNAHFVAQALRNAHSPLASFLKPQ